MIPFTKELSVKSIFVTERHAILDDVNGTKLLDLVSGEEKVVKEGMHRHVKFVPFRDPEGREGVGKVDVIVRAYDEDLEKAVNRAVNYVIDENIGELIGSVASMSFSGGVPVTVSIFSISGVGDYVAIVSGNDNAVLKYDGERFKPVILNGRTVAETLPYDEGLIDAPEYLNPFRVDDFLGDRFGLENAIVYLESFTTFQLPSGELAPFATTVIELRNGKIAFTIPDKLIDDERIEKVFKMAISYAVRNPNFTLAIIPSNDDPDKLVVEYYAINFVPDDKKKGFRVDVKVDDLSVSKLTIPTSSEYEKVKELLKDFGLDIPEVPDEIFRIVENSGYDLGLAFRFKNGKPSKVGVFYEHEGFLFGFDIFSDGEPILSAEDLKKKVAWAVEQFNAVVKPYLDEGMKVQPSGVNRGILLARVGLNLVPAYTVVYANGEFDVEPING